MQKMAMLRLLACAAAFAAQASAAEIAVHVTRSGDAFQVSATAEFEGSAERTWRVLTDYGRLAEFIPDLNSSRVISRQGREAVVEQKGEARVLFFGFPIDVRLAVTEHPYDRVVSRAVGGNFREMHNTYSLETDRQRVVLHYSGRMVPDFFIPPIIGTLALRRNVETSFRALVEEIERHQRPASGER